MQRDRPIATIRPMPERCRKRMCRRRLVIYLRFCEFRCPFLLMKRLPCASRQRVDPPLANRLGPRVPSSAPTYGHPLSSTSAGVPGFSRLRSGARMEDRSRVQRRNPQLRIGECCASAGAAYDGTAIWGHPCWSDPVVRKFWGLNRG
ncbi:hypothetical protein CALVIDRAFT_264780 [Calocera viscosa TUFC12733]|uniref:Uncharacterized protein n=1 Tax=Calocera viscosa (strain TUFC12733) TaxID=1330018 RepID=A0A167J5H4_CALVF|nr:hypothetical protein CALVIDRAFT_264780 [Calocera viscosa TUFC12733]